VLYKQLANAQVPTTDWMDPQTNWLTCGTDVNTKWVNVFGGKLSQSLSVPVYEDGNQNRSANHRVDLLPSLITAVIGNIFFYSLSFCLQYSQCPPAAPPPPTLRLVLKPPLKYRNRMMMMMIGMRVMILLSPMMMEESIKIHVILHPRSVHGMRSRPLY